MSTQVLVLPGIGNSGPEHWQSIWESENSSFRRVLQSDWDNPIRSVWEEKLEHTVSLSGSNTILVAHSLACLLVAHWAGNTRQRIKAALLVAVPDPAWPIFPAEASSFAAVPRQPLPFQSIVVNSTNDPFGSLAHAQKCAAAWNSRLVTIGDAGHINAASGLGRWDEGRELLRELMS